MNCSNCIHSVECNKMVKKPYSRLRRCTNCLLNVFANEIKDKKANLLEIGFGANRVTGRQIMRLSNQGIKWFGIDPKWDNHPEERIYNGTCAKMLFDDNSFDYVIAVNSMEHWGNYDAYEQCMKEILRVVDTGGQLYVLVPMASHGCKPFINDDIEGVRALFKEWCYVDMRCWRNDLDEKDKEYMLEIMAIK